jgi:hypothetical protein
MGYSTDFNGQFTLDMTLTEAQQAYLDQFSLTRRMKRDVRVLEGELDKAITRYPIHHSEPAENFSDPIREAAGLPLGPDGAYFVGGGKNFGQQHDQSIIDYNGPPEGQPGLWCQWVPTKDGKGIEWNGAEKFYEYVEWLEYIIEHFLISWGYTLNGEVEWCGENRDDIGKIIVTDNEVSTKGGRIVYE